MYVCDLCNRRFSTQGRLKRHRESVHRQSAGFSCQVCGQRFYRKDVLQRHLKTHRVACPTDATVYLPLPPPPSPVPPPVCDLCAKSFASQKRGSWREVPNPSSQPKFGPNPSSQADFCQNPITNDFLQNYAHNKLKALIDAIWIHVPCLVLKHGTPECRNAGTPERLNTKTRNALKIKKLKNK